MTITENKTSQTKMKRFNNFQLLNFCLGFFGLQFAWQMRIILSGPVTENLGASPFIFGLIWLAGPFTGMIVQPIIGALSDETKTRWGRRRPYLLGGAIFASLALWAFPNSQNIVNSFGHVFGFNLPVWSALLFAAVMIWIIDACVNVAQGPYRALVPDVVPKEQHSLANSYISLAIGLGSVVAAGTSPFLAWAFNVKMSIEAQFIMAALAFSLGMLWTCIFIKEKAIKKEEETFFEEKIKSNFWQDMKSFFSLSPQVGKICLAQFFTWIGVMCMFIFFTQYSVHTIFQVPDLTSASDTVRKSFENLTLEGTNFASVCFALFNLVCFFVSIPIGLLSSKYGNRKIHVIALISMAIAFLLMAFFTNQKMVLWLMALAGIGWASILALPFAMLSQYIKKGTEGSVMGIFNIFIAGPQVFVCTLVAWFISKCSYMIGSEYTNYHWEYALYIGAVSLLVATFITGFIKEKED